MVLIITSIVFVGCSSKGKKDLNNDNSKDVSSKILFLHTYSDAEESVLINKVIPKFNESFSDIEVNAMRMPTDGLKLDNSRS